MALFLTLGFTTILVMMLAATLTSTSGGNIFSQDYHRKTAALYAAESGLAMVQERLKSNPSWQGTINHQPTVFGTGEYSVSFGPSVNNLTETDPTVYKTGPYGPVAPGEAYLRVEGHALGRTEVVECVIGRKSDDFLHAAIVATGKIYMDDRVDIAGRVSSEDLSLSQADVISNYSEAAPWSNSIPPVYWDDSAAPTDRIKGVIRSASSSAGSISANLASIADEALVDQAPVPVENVDIEGAIRAKSGVAVGVPTSPTSPLTGDHYESGDIAVTGDLVLNNASLYIDGDLTVLGSIRGVGAVYVAGDTSFSGDSEVVANEDGVVLYSQGNVHLRGFDGTEWMDVVAANNGISSEWGQAKEIVRRLRQDLNSFAANPVFDAAANPAFAPPPGTPPITDSTADDYYWRSETGLLISVLSASVGGGFRPPGITDSDILTTVGSVVASQPSSPTQQFMMEKFLYLHNPAAAVGSFSTNALGVHLTGGADDTWMENFLVGSKNGVVREAGLQVEFLLAAALIHGETPGNLRFASYANLSEDELADSLVKHAHWLDLYDFDQIGKSYFQGNIYTRGAVYASNEVTIIGSLSAVDDPNKPDTAWVPSNRDPADSNISLRPGDVHLGAGTRILHVADLKPGPKSGVQPVGVSRWLR